MKIKVLVISSYNGTINSVRPEAEMFIRLHKAGLDITLMTEGHSDYARRFREEGLKVIDYHPSKKVSRSAISFIRKELKEGQYHILHLFNNKAISNGALAAVGLPVKVVTYRGYTGNIHWYDPICYLTHLSPRVDKIICLAESVEDHLRKQFVSRKKLITVNKGHDPEWFRDIKKADLRQFGIPEGAVVIACLANARRMKGIPYLMEAIQELPVELPVHFILIGHNMLTPKTKAMLEHNPNKDKVHFAGFRKDAMEIMAACPISILPSIKGEATPKAVIESMYLGVAPIITSIPGNKGMVINNVCGLVVPPRDSKALAQAIIQLGSDRQAQIDMGLRAKEHISRFLNIKDSVIRTRQVYEDLMAGRVTPSFKTSTLVEASSPEKELVI